MRPSKIHRHHRIYKRQQHQQSDSEREESYREEEEQESQTQSASYSQSQHHQSTTTPPIDDDDDYDNNDGNEETYSHSSSSSSFPPTYIPIAPLPLFHGTPSECPLSHLSLLRRVLLANTSSPPSPSLLRHVFPVTLRSHAARWHDLQTSPPSSWAQFESSFLRFFLPLEHLHCDLLTLQQSDDEPSSMFYLRMKWNLKKWPDHSLPDELLKGVFVDGLREECRDWVWLQRPETLEEAARLAENWDRAKMMKKEVKAKKCGFCDGEHEERECEVRRKMRELWLRSGSNNNSSRRIGTKEEGGDLQGLSFGLKRGWKRQISSKFERSGSGVSDRDNNGGNIVALDPQT